MFAGLEQQAKLHKCKVTELLPKSASFMSLEINTVTTRLMHDVGQAKMQKTFVFISGKS